jgi:hypothetical protein
MPALLHRDYLITYIAPRASQQPMFAAHVCGSRHRVPPRSPRTRGPRITINIALIPASSAREMMRVARDPIRSLTTIAKAVEYYDGNIRRCSILLPPSLPPPPNPVPSSSRTPLDSDPPSIRRLL